MYVSGKASRRFDFKGGRIWWNTDHDEEVKFENRGYRAETNQREETEMSVDKEHKHQIN